MPSTRTLSNGTIQDRVVSSHSVGGEVTDRSSLPVDTSRSSENVEQVEAENLPETLPVSVYNTNCISLKKFLILFQFFETKFPFLTYLFTFRFCKI